MTDRILLGTRKGLFTITRSSGPAPGRWSVSGVAFLGEHVPMCLSSPHNGTVYAALEHGHFGTKLQRSSDAGATWQEVGVPTYPTPGPGEQTINPMSGKPIEWKLQKIWALEPAHASQPDTLWCGTIPGGLFRSNDAGATWELIRTLWDDPKRNEWFGGGAELPGIHSICVHPTDPDQVAVGVSCGGVWLTTDGCATWNCRADGMWAAYMPPERQKDPNIQDAHRLVQCRSKPECYWIQHHNGVFRSTDSAKSWQDVPNVQPSVFGFAVAVHPNDPNIAWTVPGVKDETRIPVGGQVVVSRTRNGGKSWEVLRKGLPQEHAYDLTYRHGLDIDQSGERLAFGSTTGSLWITEDQGESWQNISEHLPPIYCVRFAN